MSSKPRKAEEFFYTDDHGRKQDSDLHDPILAEGDPVTAQQSSRAVMQRLGWSEDRIAKFFGASK